MSVKDRGFASMDKKKQREIASLGGKKSPGNFKNRSKEELREIARKGGRTSHKKTKKVEETI